MWTIVDSPMISPLPRRWVTVLTRVVVAQTVPTFDTPAYTLPRPSAECFLVRE